MTAGAILFGVAKRVHIHLKPTSMCGIVAVVVGGGGGGGGFLGSKPRLQLLIESDFPPWVVNFPPQEPKITIGVFSFASN